METVVDRKLADNSVPFASEGGIFIFDTIVHFFGVQFVGRIAQVK